MRKDAPLTRVLLIAVAIAATYAGVIHFGIGLTASSAKPSGSYRIEPESDPSKTSELFRAGVETAGPIHP
ncbi:MAG: hypothetical protein KTR32_08910 [Granulosicoccus sp.]|nr:hypothetical protein [Granulosicoccus sp.]